MKDIFYKVWNWYKGLRWWWKIPTCLVLFLVLVLGILYLISKFLPGKSTDFGDIDDLTGEHTEELIEYLDTEAEEMKKEIIEKKKELAKKVNQAGNIDNETLKRREKIEKAKTMEELDKLQEELDL